jgi:two-component system, NtrC family, sensor kinase
LGVAEARHQKSSSPKPQTVVFLGLNPLVLGALLLPAILFGIVAWRDRISVLHQAELALRTNVRILAEHAVNAFQALVLIGDVAGEHIQGRTWSEVSETPSVHEFLAELIKDNPRISALWLADTEGVVRNSSVAFPAPPVSIADRDYFNAIKDESIEAFVGGIVRENINQEGVFNVARRRRSEPGRFEGVVVVAARPSTLTAFWGAVANDGGEGILVRRDGKVLTTTSSADASGTSAQPDDRLLRAIRVGTEAGSYRLVSADGRESLFAYRQVGEYGVYVGRSIPVSTALERWRNHMVFYGGFFLMVTTALVSLALVASRRLELLHQSVDALRQEIDHRESVEVQFWEAQKMEALGRLAGESAHEFGNVLSVISGSLDTLEIRPGATKALDLARSASERGLRMISAMLTFARRREPHRELLDLRAAVLDMEELLRQALGAHTLLEIQAPEACPAYIDRNQFEQAVLNLAVNARDAMVDGGRLLVRTAVAALSGEPDGLVGDYAVVTVQDTGCGMPPEILSRILEPFFTTKEPGKGTGLGLSMVEGFCKQAGGTVSIRSIVGYGTAVSMYLPLSLASSDLPAAVSSASS